MKKIALFTVVCLMTLPLMAQKNPIKLLLDVSSPDPKTHEAVAFHLGSLTKNYPNSQFELVLYGKSYDMVVAKKSSVANAIEKLAKNENVSIKICQIAMDHFDVKKDMLIPGVEPVPDAFMEIALRQNEGWAYIKEAHH